jgi:hypothetical protein
MFVLLFSVDVGGEGDGDGRPEDTPLGECPCEGKNMLGGNRGKKREGGRERN